MTSSDLDHVSTFDVAETPVLTTRPSLTLKYMLGLLVLVCTDDHQYMKSGQHYGHDQSRYRCQCMTKCGQLSGMNNPFETVLQINA